MAVLWDILVGFWAVLAEMAPWLLFGFLAAGVLSVFFKPAWIERHLGGGGFGPVVKASVFGVPLPVCSCGVIPLAAGLYRHGASKGATSSFLLSTPQTGVDSILATWGLMGPVFGLIRPVIALVSGIVGGLVIDRVDRAERVEGNRTRAVADAPGTDCCAPAGPGASARGADPSGHATLWSKLVAALRYGLITLPGDLAGSLLVGLALAAVLTAAVDPETLAPWLGHPWWGLLTAVVIGTPIYVCSTGSIPIAVGLMAVGASPGAALAFLIAGPATNAATISVIWNVLGRRSAVTYLGVVLATALGAGWALNASLAAGLGLMLPPGVLHPHEHALTRIDHTWAALMVAVIGVGLLTRYGVLRRGAAPAAPPPGHAGGDADADLPTPAERTTELAITGMTCSHCAASADRALREVPGVREVVVDLAGKRATVRGDAADPSALLDALKSLGYGATLAR